MRPLAAILAGSALYVAAGSLVPFGMSHRLSEQCAWVPNPVLSDLGLARGEPSYRENMARVACFHRRGLASDSPLVRDLRRNWPSEAEFTAWRKIDGERHVRAE
jgi:hypothetical protein